MHKKIISIISLFTILISLLNINTLHAGSNDGYFIVTAYYSPLPNQSKYIMGNYEAEVRMNGQGYRGAGGKKVFSGMLAAPGIYSFGTKIYLEGLGVGEVADRGGAIVKSGERNFKHDRIDLWVGHGEEGLQRAMYWGKRKIKGSVVNRATKVNTNIKKLAAPKWTTAYLKNNPSYVVQNKKYPFFNYGIGTKSKKESIVTLQKFLQKVSLYNGVANGVYNSEIINSIYRFQKENHIVKNWSDVNAGYWSVQTRNLVWEKYQAGEFTKKETQIKLTKNKVLETKITLSNAKPPLKNIAHTQSEKLIDIFGKKIDSSEGVKRLQRILKKLEYYNGDITGEYSDVKKSVLSFQLKNNVIQSDSAIGAGNYGPATRKTLDYAYKLYGMDKKTDNAIQNLIQEVEDNQKALSDLDKKSKLKEATTRIKNLGNIKFGDVAHEVRDLQKILNKLGFFDQKDTAIFGGQTKKALIEYQLRKEVIKNEEIYGAGLLGPKTKKQLIKDLSET